MAVADDLLRDSIDQHAHPSPEFSTSMPGRLTNLEWAAMAADQGMRAIVVKSHVFPTMPLASAMQSAVEGLEVFSGITLNPPVGGISALSVELAAEAGARVVWMPTWAARQPVARPSAMLDRKASKAPTVGATDWPSSGLAVVDESGSLTSEVEAVLSVCTQRRLTLASGHMPISDSLLLAARAAELGISFVLTHPLSAAVGATIEDQQRIGELGGLVEHVFLGCMPMHQRMGPQRVYAVRVVGPEHCVLGTDAIEAWNPPEPEMMRMAIASLLHLGLSADDVRLMTHKYPARALGIEEEADPRLAGQEIPTEQSEGG